jgi:hypothetical protein
MIEIYPSAIATSSGAQLEKQRQGLNDLLTDQRNGWPRPRMWGQYQVREWLCQIRAPPQQEVAELASREPFVPMGATA